MTETFTDRRDAGRRLGEHLAGQLEFGDPVVLGLPRGGVPVAFEVARRLDAPLEVFLVRKLGVPGHEELAMGAIASGGVRVLNESVVEGVGVGEQDVATVAAREQAELERRERLYRGGVAVAELAGRDAIVVDDGLATGSTMRAAVQAVRAQGAARVVAAVPVADPAVCASLGDEVDAIVCLQQPDRLRSVGSWYDDFTPTADEEVVELLQRARSSG